MSNNSSAAGGGATNFLDPTKVFILENITTLEHFYDQVTNHLKLADWFGRNLDALNDVLRGGCGEIDPAASTFIWKDSTASKNM